jgi:hypothetical protein
VRQLDSGIKCHFDEKGIVLWLKQKNKQTNKQKTEISLLLFFL